MRSPELYPETKEFIEFLAAFKNESDRGAALVAASILDVRLQEILSAFFVDSSTSRDLLSGFNAPLGTFSSRASMAFSLGLIQENEFKEITVIRKIRNAYGHGWEPLTFKSGAIAALSGKLPWLGPVEHEATATLRTRFNFAIAILVSDLMWRSKLVANERRIPKIWPNRARSA